jgi:uncharacterized protein (DUF2267 family)
MATITPDPRQIKRARRSESHKATTWGAFLNELREHGDWSREFAEQATTAVLCTLERRITSNVAGHMEAQLPARLRELLASCERRSALKPRKIGRPEFMTLIAEDLDLTLQQAELVAREVLATVRTHISEGEALQVEKQLPMELRDLWWPPV